MVYQVPKDEILRLVREVEARYIGRTDLKTIIEIIEEMANVEARRLEVGAILSKMRKRKKGRDPKREEELHREYVMLGAQKIALNAALNRVVSRIVALMAMRRAGL